MDWGLARFLASPKTTHLSTAPSPLWFLPFLNVLVLPYSVLTSKTKRLNCHVVEHPFFATQMFLFITLKVWCNTLGGWKSNREFYRWCWERKDKNWEKFRLKIIAMVKLTSQLCIDELLPIYTFFSIPFICMFSICFSAWVHP